jgi:hypothetical protein
VAGGALHLGRVVTCCQPMKMHTPDGANRQVVATQ